MNIVSAIEQFDNEIAKKKKDISKFLKLYTLSTIAVEHLNVEVNELENEIEILEKKKKSLQEQLMTMNNLQSNLEKIDKFLNNLKAIHRLTMETKIKILDLLIKEMQIDYDNESKRHIVSIVYNLPSDLEPRNFWRVKKSLDY